jgi:3-hydroxyisobutyrate dehydrogenase-like beta-hydroxyacid dehydrogenase
MLLGGPHAAALEPLLAPLGFSMEVVADRVGVASAIKMCRSIMIKGLEALVVESFTTARRYGVEEYVLASLRETFPTLDWEQQGAYLFSRVAQHGKRRAEEMREVAVTVHEAGLAPHMAAATAERQDWVAAMRPANRQGREGRELAQYADRLLVLAEPAGGLIAAPQRRAAISPWGNITFGIACAGLAVVSCQVRSRMVAATSPRQR